MLVSNIALTLFCAIASASPLPNTANLAKRAIVELEGVNYNEAFSPATMGVFTKDMTNLNFNGHGGAVLFTREHKVASGTDPTNPNKLDMVNPRKIVVMPEQLADFMQTNEIAKGGGGSRTAANYLIVDLRDDSKSLCLFPDVF
jgi:hypothetical protein